MAIWKRPLDYFLSSIPKEYEVSIEEIESLLKLLQKQAPPGIGARDLIECLTLQLESKEESPIHILSIKVIKISSKPSSLLVTLLSLKKY